LKLCHDDLGYSDPQIYENPSCNKRDPMQRDNYNSPDLTIKRVVGLILSTAYQTASSCIKTSTRAVKRWVIHVQLFFHRPNGMCALADVTVRLTENGEVKKVRVVMWTLPLLSS